MEELIQKIQKLSLTRTDRGIAEYILEHLDTIGLQTSTTLAQEIGVSDSSVIRFIRKLGFKGYSEFRSEMNDRMARQYTMTQEDLSPGEKYEKTRGTLKQGSLVYDVGNYTLDNLQKSFSRLDNDKVNQIADIILSSNRKYISGFRGAACCAQYMSSKLIFLISNVVPLLHADATSVEQMIDISAQDCLIVYSFPRYSELQHVLMDLAKSRGAKIILFTDRITSPLAGKADVVVTANVNGLGFTNSYVAPLALTEVVLLAVSSRGEEIYGKRMNWIDQIMGDYKLY